MNRIEQVWHQGGHFLMPFIENNLQIAYLESRLLLAYSLNKSMTYLLTYPEIELTTEEQAKYQQYLQRRANGTPIAYIIGFCEFWSLPIKVSPATLIPRHDTELLVEIALNCLKQNTGPILPNDNLAVLDLGTGTGAIALAIASERVDCDITGVDVQHEAVQLAQENSITLNLNKNCHFIQSHWFSVFEQSNQIKRFDLIVSNPPYIDGQDPHLLRGDLRYEPKTALVALDQGMADICLICTQAPYYLKHKGWLWIEHGYQQAEQVQYLLKNNGFEQRQTYRDYQGQDRVTGGQYCHPLAV